MDVVIKAEMWKSVMKMLSPSEAKTFLDIAVLSDEQGCLDATTKFLSSSIGLCRNTIYRGLHGLEEKGVFESVETKAGHGGFKIKINPNLMHKVSE